MPKRSSSGYLSVPSKKRRRLAGDFAAFNPEYDVANSQAPATDSIINATSVSTRPPQRRRAATPSLASLASKRFAFYFSTLLGSEENQRHAAQYLRILPDTILARLVDDLKKYRPTFMSNGFISAYFLRPPSVALDSTLTGVNKHTITGIQRAGSQLTSLSLRGFDKFSDATFASIFPSLPCLETLVLKGCTKVGERTVGAITKSCHQLRVVNLNHTTPTAASLGRLLVSCKKLEVFKIAAVPKIASDLPNRFLIYDDWRLFQTPQFLASLARSEPGIVSTCLTSLKLRYIATPDLPLISLLGHFPALRRLDASFTKVTSLSPSRFLEHPIRPLSLPDLEKLNLTAIPLKPGSAGLVHFVANFPSLRTLSIGGIGGQENPTILRDRDLALLTSRLSGESSNAWPPVRVPLENVNLAGNSRLEGPALQYFVRKLGRYCRELNLASLKGVTSDTLEGLLPQPDTPPPHARIASENDAYPEEWDDNTSCLEHLNLASTSVDDGAVPFISSCRRLRSLNISKTKISSEITAPRLCLV
ncbi:uncharacterized protein EI90DRAFT_2563380 [Cantharellus anzutake]|uniref:uncharacterized protein n=1 Tax=Cantharellus anzutake TaxID=1750568 RepID=UPI0019089E26|nr:uncharacterized protein EI90DRAFT_2563380 [Cantharellus anzutake]KAF8338239.1 hypothetical protein EI90DRAFT_2563380 [Cantharellus anzutake]